MPIKKVAVLNAMVRKKNTEYYTPIVACETCSLDIPARTVSILHQSWYNLI